MSRAYVQAVAAQAGMSYAWHEPDYGIDLSLRAIVARGGHLSGTGPHLDLQLKSTTRANVGKDQVTYDLQVKNYEDLRDPTANCPCLLVVFVMPEDETQWLTQSESELILRHCAYWQSLEGWPPTEANTTVRVALPRRNLFSMTMLQDLMLRLRRKEQP